MRALIVGAGIAGLTVAGELASRGHDVTLCERERAPPSDDHIVDLCGAGFDVAARLGLLPALERARHAIARLVLLDGRGRARGEIDYRRVRDAAFAGRQLHVLRSELVALLLARLPSVVQIRFGTSPQEIEHDGHQVAVALSDRTREHYDVVVGADGVHSRVRQIVVPRNAVRHVRLRCRYAACVIPARLPGTAERSLAWLTVANASAVFYPIDRDRTAAIVLYRSDGSARAPSVAEIEARLRGHGRQADALLDALAASDRLRVEDALEIHLDRWTRGRVVLVGDACGAACPFGGRGASTAITGAYLLGHELARGADIDRALASYEPRVRPAVDAQQRCGRQRLAWLLPRSGVGAALRDRAASMLARSRFIDLFGSALAAAEGRLGEALDGVLGERSNP